MCNTTKAKLQCSAISTTNRLTSLNATLSMAPVELHRTKQLPPSCKKCVCFQINGRSSHAAQCVKSRMMNKVIDSILSVDTFEQKCVLIKGMLQSPCLGDHMKTIGIDQSLWNRSSFEYKCLNNIKKIYQHADKCDHQQNLKDALDADMVSTPEEIIANNMSLLMTSTTATKKSARK